MLSGNTAGVAGEDDAAEETSGLNVAHFSLASFSPLNHQPAANAVSTVAMQKTIATMVDVGTSDGSGKLRGGGYDSDRSRGREGPQANGCPCSGARRSVRRGVAATGWRG